MKLALTVIVDSREQNCWTFSLPVELGTLDAGDYSTRGLTHLIAVERKSLPDLVVCCGSGRARFKRELQRLRAYRFRCLVVEATLAEIEAGNWRGKVQPAHVLGSLAAWQAQYQLPIVFSGNHEAAGQSGGNAKRSARWWSRSRRGLRREHVPDQFCHEADQQGGNRELDPDAQPRPIVEPFAQHVAKVRESVE